MSTWDVICLSPHPDDAVYSVGGTLAALSRAGRQVLVVTLCGGPPSGAPISPFARELHEAMGLDEATAAATRRSEDERALVCLGVHRHEAGFLDAIYRLPDAYASLEVLLGGIPATGDRLHVSVDALVADLRRQSPVALILAPLAAGGHVDHVLAFAAARRAPGPIAFYEDFPYVAQFPGSVASRTEGLAPFALDVRPDVELRIAAAGAYISQIPLLFGDAGGLERAIRAHPAERLWR